MKKEEKQTSTDVIKNIANIKKIWTVTLHWENDYSEDTSFYKRELAKAYMLGLATANHKKVYGSLTKYTFHDGKLVNY